MGKASLLVKSENDKLSQILNLITHILPIGVIFNVSKTDKYFDLIIVLEQNYNYVSKSIDVLMEPALLNFSNCTYSLHTFSGIHQQIQRGVLFYCTTCISQNVIYKKETTNLPLQCKRYVFKQQVLNYDKVFKREMDTAIHFLKGAIWYMEHKIFSLATFMLHQATELTYRAFLVGLENKIIRTHDLNKLRQYLKRFVPQILGAFDEDEIIEIRLLGLLEKAYCDARYNELYQISSTRVTKLLGGVERLHAKAVAVYNEQIFRWNNSLEIEL